MGMLYVSGVNSDEGVKLVGDRVLLMSSVIDFCKTLPGAASGTAILRGFRPIESRYGRITLGPKVLGWRKGKSIHSLWSGLGHLGPP
jgi:hypothetical protein